MILSVSHISKSFGDNSVLSDVSFLVNEHEKVALIGRNGAGKSTLFKIITGEVSADEGVATVAKDARLGYLAQHQDISGDRSVYEEVRAVKDRIWAMEARMHDLEESMKHADGDALASMYREYNAVSHEYEQANGYSAGSEVVGVLRGLGFSENDWDKKTSVLSGGQKTRVALAKLLLETPDILLLDEPTNHLDLNSVAWLETFLANYKGAVLIVSHDRYFLNKIVTKVVEIDHMKSMVFPGNLPPRRRCFATRSERPTKSSRPRSATRRKSSPSSVLSAAKRPSSALRAVRRFWRKWRNWTVLSRRSAA